MHARGDRDFAAAAQTPEGRGYTPHSIGRQHRDVPYWTRDLELSAWLGRPELSTLRDLTDKELGAIVASGILDWDLGRPLTRSRLGGLLAAR